MAYDNIFIALVFLINPIYCLKASRRAIARFCMVYGDYLLLLLLFYILSVCKCLLYTCFVQH